MTDPLGRASQELALDLYRALARDGDLILSPFSISAALAMLHAGARGETASQIEALLHVRSGNPALAGEYERFLAAINGEGKRPYQLITANAAWVNREVRLQQSYQAIVEKHFSGRVEAIDFRDAHQAAATINGWIRENTRGMIPTVVAPDMFSADTLLVLANAIYLKASWLNQFDPERTSEERFHVSREQTVTVKMMATLQRMRMATVPGGRMLEIRYAGGELALLVVLPDFIGTLHSIEEQLSIQALEKWHAAMSSRQVFLSLPRFESETFVSLRNVLRTLGMTLAFMPDADLSGVAEEEPVMVSDVLHKAKVIVDEVGTEAAAATVVIATRAGRMAQPEIFRADHPFLYMIRHTPTGAMLFIGKFTGASIPASADRLSA